MAKERARTSQWRSLVLVSVGALGLGAGAAWGVLFEPSQGLDVGSPASITYPLKALDYSDGQSADITVRLPQDGSIDVEQTGKITDSRCKTGGTVKSGEVLASVQGAPVIALATSVPFYRSLVIGDSGEDVAALKTALESLGHLKGESVSSNKLDRVTLDALELLNKQALSKAHKEADTAASAVTTQLAQSDIKPLKSFDPAGYAWLPQETVTVTECLKALGQTHDGSTFARISTTNPTVTVQFPEVLVDGERTLTFEGVEIAVDGQGIIAPDQVSTITESQSFIVAQLQDESAQDLKLQGQYELKQPLTVYAVPPAALKLVTPENGCVFSGTNPGSSHAVKLLSSSLGLTYVQFEQGVQVPKNVVINPLEDQQCG